MAYIGQSPFQEFTNPPTKDTFTGDGSTTTFDLDQEVPSSGEFGLEVFVNNVRQEPGSGKAFTLGVDGSGDNKRITFSAAPANGAAIYVINDKTNASLIAPLDFDTNGTELILDGDGDTSLHASTDDQIDIKIAGIDVANVTTANSGDLVITNVVSDKDFVIKGNDGGSTITPFTIDMSAGGDLFLTGGLIDLKNDGSAVSQIKFYCESSNAHAQTVIGAPHSESASNTLTLPSTGGDARLVSTSSTATLTNKTLTTPVIAEIDSGSTITLDATTDIILDADGGDIFFKDGGTTFGSATNTSGNLILKSGTTTAATFSGANVTLAGTVGSGAITSTGIVTGTGFTAGSAVLAEAELELLDGLTAGTAIASKVVTTDANIDTTGQRNLTISGELDAATLDISGDADIDGTSNLDIVDIDVSLDVNGTIKLDGNYPVGTTNTALGDIAFSAIQAGAERNVAVGNQALEKLTTGDDNVALGNRALCTNVTGHRNIAIGKDSLRTNTGSDNVAVGHEALVLNTTGTYNTAVGTLALDANQTTNSNTAIGYAALGVNVASNNTAVGTSALDANTSGASNVAVGVAALGANTTASDNTAIGASALTANTTGTGNVSVGALALDANTTGDSNTAVGKQALSANTTADNNTAVGRQALFTNTTGAGNTAVGFESLKANTEGDDNTAIGMCAMCSTSTGSSSVAVGRRALTSQYNRCSQCCNGI